MSVNWSSNEITATSLPDKKEKESPSLGAVTASPASSVKAEPFSPSSSPQNKKESAKVENSSTEEVACAPVVATIDNTVVYSVNSLLLSSNVEENSATSTMAGIKTEMPPLHSVSNSTVSAAADSSDNQPPTPTPDQPPTHHQQHQQQQQQQQQQQPPQQQQQHLQHQQHQHQLYGSGATLVNSNQMYQDMHSYHPPAASYLSGYEQFYHASAGVDYGSAMQQLQQNQVLSYQMQNQSLTGAASPHTDYKVAPSSQRYHPYLNNGGIHHLTPPQNHSSSVGANGVSSGNNASSSVSNSSLSPRVVSSSSPSQNHSAANTPHHGLADVGAMTNRASTPTTSKQCNKCGVMCANETELSEHYSALHGVQNAENCNISSVERSTTSAADRSQYQTFAPYIKEEPPSSDILDLDSQKMVYPPPEGDVVGGVNPGLHPMQRPMTWPQEMHPGYMAAPHLTETKHTGYYPKQDFTSIKSEFHPIKSEYVSPTNFGSSTLKPSDYTQPIASQNRPDDKSFANADLTSGNNPVSSSPSEFPSTTTPQDNLSQYRGFEPPTSSLPSSGGATKSATWKSNEARRPKTYNCTACNKWFTSSGHLKRHYNTTLHKNAVKSSGQPDPATMPISAHHHPSRDPNSKHHRNSQSRQPPPIPPEPPRSPDFSSQYTTQSPNGFVPQAQQQSQAFQQYHPQSNLNSSVNGHPNGLAGPSVQASQPRGLLTIMSTEVSIMDQEEDQLHISSNNNNNSSSNNNNSNNLHLQEEQFHQQQQQQQEIQECSPNNSPNSNSSLEEYQSTINLQQQQQSQQQQLLPLQSPHIISHPQYREVHPIHHHHQQESTIFNTATTIHNIMDQQQQQLLQPQPQQYIISPLAINTTTPITLNNTTTTIPSFQHLQQPAAEHQPSYHTIIGSDGQTITNNPQDGNLIQLSSFVDLSTLTGSQTFQEINQQQLQQQHMVALDANGQVIQLVHHQPMVDIQRISGGMPTFKERLMQATSPVAPAPESYYNRMSEFGSQGSPQEADIPPINSTASGPQNDQNPYSPTVSSSTTSTNLVPIVGEKSKITNATPLIKPSSKRKRESSTQNATSTTLPTGRIKCVECDKEFTKICYLTQHNKSFHSGEQPYRCQKCGKRFQIEDIYDAHLARHKSQDKPHKCDLCPKQFHHKTDLRRHKEAIHTGFKAHTCDMCNKSFCRKDHLRKHCDIHTRPKPVKKTKTKTSVPNRKQSQNDKIPKTDPEFPLVDEPNSSNPPPIPNVDESENSCSQSLSQSQLQSHLMPKLDIKVEAYAIAGEELVYM